MGLIKSSYTPKWVHKGLVIYMCMTFAHSLFSQNICELMVASEPLQTLVNSTQLFATQQSKQYTLSWNTNTGMDTVAQIVLPGLKISNTLHLSNLGLDIPKGAIISGLKITLSGNSIGNGYIKDNTITLSNGLKTSDNYAGFGYSAKRVWAKKQYNEQWHYGRNDDTWGQDWTSEDLNSKDFAIDIQIRNILNTEVIATLVNASIEVTYTPLPTFCVMSCPVFYVKDFPKDARYFWHIPEGIVYTSKDNESYIVDLHMTDSASYGVYNLCVDAYDGDIIVKQCCRDFRYVDCDPGSIGDFVWNDLNVNGIQDPNEPGISGIKISLFNENDQLINTTITDYTGKYSFIGVEKGKYYIKVELPNKYVFTIPLVGANDKDSNISGVKGPSTSNLINVDYAEDVTHVDIGLIEQTEIKGITWEDINGDGIRSSSDSPIGGITVYLVNVQGDTILQTSTNFNGEYEFTNVNLGSYDVRFGFSNQYFATLKDKGLDDVDSDINPEFGTGYMIASSSGLFHIDAGVYKSNVIGDQVWRDINCNGEFDTADQPFPDIEIVLINEIGIRVDSTITDLVGIYNFYNILPGYYSILVKDQPTYTATVKINSVINDVNGRLITDLFIVKSGDTIDYLDFGLIKLKSNICGVAWFDENYNGIREGDELLLSGVPVKLIDASDVVIDNTLTDLEGNYCFKDLLPATYKIQFIKEDFQVFSPNLQGNPDNNSDVIDDQGITSPIFLKSGKNQSHYDAGFANKAIVGDYIWLDDNSNGIQEANELGVQDVRVKLMNLQNVAVDSTVTDDNGYYIFEFIQPNDYYFSIDLDTTYKAVLDQGGNASLNSDFTNVNGQNTSSTFSLNANEINLNIDFGLEINFGSICGSFWIDENSDGLRTANESVVMDQVLVEAYNDSGDLSSITLTDSEGNYCLSGLSSGNYTVLATVPNIYQFTKKDSGIDDEIDSDFEKDGYVLTIPLTSGEVLTNIDGGLTFKSILGDYVWLDDDGNGIQDNNELGIQDIQVSLMDENNVIIDATTTNELGYYQFFDVTEGNYYMSFSLLEGLVFTRQNISTSLGSDPDFNGITPLFKVEAFNDNFDLDAGMTVPLGSITGLAWEDSNADGQRGVDEPVIPNVGVQLINENLTVLRYTLTDNNGNYYFFDLQQGNYFVVFDTIPTRGFTAPYVGIASQDSDVTSTMGFGSTDLLALNVGEHKKNIDAGFTFFGSSIKGTSWLDLSGDGVFATEDKPFIDIEVTLYTLDTQVVLNQLVNPDGTYTFLNVAEGNYFITFNPSEDCYFPTLSHIGLDTLSDSDITSLYFQNSTNLLSVKTGTDICGVNGGFIGYSSINGMVFNDFNENGIRDTDDTGFNGVAVCLKDLMGNNIAFDTTSSRNGIVGVYGFSNLLPGKYIVKFTRPLFYLPTLQDQGNDDFVDSDASLLLGLIATTDTIVINSKSLLKNIDLGLIYRQEMQSMIAGEVWKELQVDGIQQITEPLQEGIEIKLFEQNGTFLASTLTNPLGEYQFANLTEGFYYLEAALPISETATYLQKGADFSIDNNFTTIDEKVKTPPFYLAIFTDSMQIDLGITDAIAIGDYVWYDANFDGLQNSTESPFIGAELVLMDEDSNILMTTTSDINGKYAFNRIPVGKYQLEIILPNDHFTTRQITGFDNTNNNFGPNGLTPIYDLTTGGDIDSIDAGVVASGSIGNMIFIDFNGNGINNSNEPGMSGYQVSLYNDKNQLIDIDSTQGNMTAGLGGFYTFENVRPGEYYLVFDIQDGYKFTIPNIGAENVDSDVTSKVVFGSTDIFTLLPNEINNDIDCGIFLPSTLGDYVWEDVNKNGIQETGENGFPNVEVFLLRSNGQVISSTFTDSEGKYIFTDLNQGLYSLKFSQIPDYEITLKDNAPDDMTDSDADPISGVTSLISLAHGATFLGVDCGYYSTDTANDYNPDTPYSNLKLDLINSRFETVNPMPNPAVFETILKVKNDGVFHLSMMNANGQIIEQKTVLASEGIIKLDVSNYRAGKFYFILRNESKNYRGHLIRIF